MVTPEINLVIILMVALVNCITAVIALLTKRDMANLEKNTNSKMDTLLDTTKQLAYGQGQAEGLQQGRDEMKPEATMKVEITNMPTIGDISGTDGNKV